MKKRMNAYWTIAQELFLAPLAYLLGARAYTLYIRYADGEPLAPFTDVLFNKNIEEVTVANAVSKFDEINKALYSTVSSKETLLEPISYISYLRNHISEILIFA